MTDARSLALPADLAGLVDRLKALCAGYPTNRYMPSKQMSFAEADCLVTTTFSIFAEAATAITALSARVAELEAQATEYATRLDLLQFAANQADFKKRAAEAQASLARRLALEDAAKVCDRWADQNEPFAETNSTKQGKVSASRYCATAIRALSPTLDMDALTARAIEAAQSAYSGAPDSHSQNAANVARAVLSALLEGGE